MAYPATFDIQRPTKDFDRTQIILRIIIIFVIGWLLNWLVGAAYWLFPIIAAVMISQKGSQQYLAEAESGPTTWLRYIIGIYAYIALATDKLPFEGPQEGVKLDVRTTGSPTVGSALLRIILGIPQAIVLGIIGIAFFFVWIFAALSIIFTGQYPEWAFNFIRGYLGWNVRLLAYMASLVDEYPPFSFGDGGSSVAQTAPPTPPPAQPS